ADAAEHQQSTGDKQRDTGRQVVPGAAQREQPAAAYGKGEPEQGDDAAKQPSRPVGSGVRAFTEHRGPPMWLGSAFILGTALDPSGEDGATARRWLHRPARRLGILSDRSAR